MGVSGAAPAMEVVTAEVGGAKVKGAAGSGGSGSATSGDTSSSSATTSVSKRRRVDVHSRNGGDCVIASADSSCVVKRGKLEVAAVEVNSAAADENFGAPVAVEEDGERCLSGDVEDPGTASCCSSNGADESVDLEAMSGGVGEVTIQTSYRRERTHDEENNVAKPLATAYNPRRRRLPARMPSQAEIEDFFSAVERKSALQFKEKYNFDFEKEEPLGGRYEWRPLTAGAAAKEKGIMEA
ncbi:hypothetical protein MLD38_003172 [Melastoma candidum]|uniref:Uncharacterized protein n=1 Tax=Melastoma candidum TaxID=119954 RepID=A0ACB9S669_9MYRT|nr:hypothetical protein MLD38_003172 [Melastoma candidum]